MKRLKKDLREWLKGATKIVIMGVGNPLRADDYIGPVIVEKLSKVRLPENVSLLNCETAPENYISQIEKLSPSHVIFIDAAQLNESPGKVKLIPPDMIKETTLSTHTISLTFITKFLEHSISAKAILLAVQPKSIAFNEGLTSELDGASTKLVKLISEAIHS